MRNRSQGMTLIELVIAMLILAILVGIAVPSFREFAGNSKASAASSSLTTALSLARSEALRRSSSVRVCPTTDQATCANSTDWATGWLVFADRNRNGNVDNNELVQVWGPVSPQVTATASANRASYDAMGMLQPGSAAVTFLVAFDGCSGNRQRQSVLSLSGSVQTTLVACP